MIRKAFVMSVNPGCEEEYKRRHNPIWPELQQTLHDHGVASYSIFLHEQTHQLFAYAEIENEERWNAIAKTEICRRWWLSMRDLMPANDDASPVSITLDEIFHIDRAVTGDQ